MTDDQHLPALRSSMQGGVPAPSLAGHSLSPLNTWRYSRNIQRHLAHAVYQFEIEMIDLEAASQMALAQLQAELTLYFVGMKMAGSDTPAQYLVANKLATFAASNSMRLQWRTR